MLKANRYQRMVRERGIGVVLPSPVSYFELSQVKSKPKAISYTSTVAHNKETTQQKLISLQSQKLKPVDRPYSCWSVPPEKRTSKHWPHTLATHRHNFPSTFFLHGPTLLRVKQCTLTMECRSANHRRTGFQKVSERRKRDTVNIPNKPAKRGITSEMKAKEKKLGNLGKRKEGRRTEGFETSYVIKATPFLPAWWGCNLIRWTFPYASKIACRWDSSTTAGVKPAT